MGKKIYVRLEEGYQVVKESTLKHQKIPPKSKPQPPIIVIIASVYLALTLALTLKATIEGNADFELPDSSPPVDPHPLPPDHYPSQPAPLPPCPDPRVPYC